MNSLISAFATAVKPAFHGLRNGNDLSVAKTDPYSHSVKARNENIAKLITVAPTSHGDVFWWGERRSIGLRQQTQKVCSKNY